MKTIDTINLGNNEMLINTINRYEEGEYELFEAELGWKDWMNQLINKEDEEEQLTEWEIEIINNFLKKMWNYAKNITREEMINTIFHFCKKWEHWFNLECYEWIDDYGEWKEYEFSLYKNWKCFASTSDDPNHLSWADIERWLARNMESLSNEDLLVLLWWNFLSKNEYFNREGIVFSDAY